MKDDIVSGVRRVGDYIQIGSSGASLHAQACHDAADEITRLRKELADRDREYICSCGRRVSPHVCNPYKLF